MVAVYRGGDDDFSSMVYGIPNLNVLSYMENQFVNTNPEIYTNSSFLDRALEVYNQYSGSEAINRARAIIDMTDSSTDLNMIRYLGDNDNILSIQTATPIMQRFIMANPTVRYLYHKQRIDGYHESYIDEHEQDVGEDHYDYRRVMDGIIETSDDFDGGYRVRFYLDPLKEEDRELVASEKFDILNTWDNIERLLDSQDEDPTDIRGGKL